MLVIVLVGVLESAYSLFQLYFENDTVLWVDKSFHKGFASGTYFNRNHLAGFLELCIGFNLGLWLYVFWRRDAGKILWYGVFLLIMFYALIKTGSRMGLISTLVAISAGYLMLLGKKRRVNSLFLIILLVAGCSAIWLSRDLLLDRFDKLSVHLMTWEGRLTTWGDALLALNAYFQKGAGLGNFEWIFPNFQSEALTWGWSHVHNDYLELAIELGIPAFVLLCFSFFSLLSWLIVQYVQSQDEDAALIWGGMIGISAFLIHNITDFNFAIPGNSLLFFLCLAIVTRIAFGHQVLEKPEIKWAAFNKIKRWMFRFCVCVLTLFLGVFSAQKSWAGYLHYQGRAAMHQKEFKQAMEIFERVTPLDKKNPQLAFDYGLSAWKIGIREKNPAWFKLAASQFEKVTEWMPSYARGWLYLGLSKLYFNREARRASPEAEEALSLIEKAYEMESGSAWVAYMTGINMLTHSHLLTKEKKRLAFLRIKKSIHISPKEFLKPVISFLWTQYHDWDLLVQTMQGNYDSYKILINFLMSKDEWQQVARVYPEYFKIKEEEYQSHCETGTLYLNDRKYDQALVSFEKAYWMDQNRSWAKAGMLISQEALDQLPDAYRTTLKSVLEDEDEPMDSIVQHLGDVVSLGKDPYLMALFSFRMKDYESTVKWFQSVRDGEMHRRYLATAYQALGERQKAIEVLSPVLGDEDVDLRDLLLLESLDTANAADIRAKIDIKITRHRPANAWSDEWRTRMELIGSGKTGMLLNLTPGEKMVDVNLKGWPDALGNHGVLLFRVQNKVIGTAYVVYDEWYKILLTFTTTGGRRWFEAELIQFENLKGDRKGPLIKLGDVEIE